MSNAAINERIKEVYREKIFGNLNGGSKARSSETGKAAAKLGTALKGVDPDEIIKRADYKTDGEYLMALADFEAKMQTPEFRQAMAKVTQREREKADARAREEQRKQYAEIRKGLKLDSYERETVDKQARAQAEAEYRAGRITSAEVGTKACQYAAALEKAALDRKANNMQTNDFIRGAWHGAINGPDEPDEDE